MSVWMKDGSAIIAINLHGKMIERINVSCDRQGRRGRSSLFLKRGAILSQER